MATGARISDQGDDSYSWGQAARSGIFWAGLAQKPINIERFIAGVKK